MSTPRRGHGRAGERLSTSWPPDRAPRAPVYCGRASRWRRPRGPVRPPPAVARRVVSAGTPPQVISQLHPYRFSGLVRDPAEPAGRGPCSSVPPVAQSAQSAPGRKITCPRPPNEPDRRPPALPYRRRVRCLVCSVTWGHRGRSPQCPTSRTAFRRSRHSRKRSSPTLHSQRIARYPCQSQLGPRKDRPVP